MQPGRWKLFPEPDAAEYSIEVFGKASERVVAVAGQSVIFGERARWQHLRTHAGQLVYLPTPDI